MGIPGTLSGPMVSATSDIPLFSAAGFNVGDNVFIADCNETAAFSLTGFAGTSLRHTVGANTNASLGRVFAEDALVMRFETHAYYVAPSSRDPATETSLWMLSSAAGAPVEVVEDVEGLQIQYGEDTDADYVAMCSARPTRSWTSPKSWRSRSTCWCAARAAMKRRWLPTTSSTARPSSPADRYTRRVYTATIQLRNRTL